ncbi:MAG: hypothetical protein FWD89_03140 [Firmicutes bacterium]|jgi:hypothetical protein|nr:hypothetical protein [Bacillota bacterium]MCL2771285.1 hypothetical protein [Bacillota bacterium]
MENTLSIVLSNKTWLRQQLDKFTEALYVNIAYLFKDVPKKEVSDPMAILAASRIHFFQKEVPNKDEYGKHFVVGMEVANYFDNEFRNFANKRELLTMEEKTQIRNKLYELVNKVTDDIETAIKKVLVTPSFKSYFKADLSDDDDVMDEEAK